ncbi:MAG: hypothetical protein M3R62_12995, partial [Acidobacteriota bacterium]|nr:hypothetical protein [Acidobacteriota bacterium]
MSRTPPETGIAPPGLRRRLFGGVAATGAIFSLFLAAALLHGMPPDPPPGSGAIVWRGTSHPVALAGGDLKVTDVAAALGFETATDSTSGVLTLSAGGHQVYLGVGTTQVPVD